MPCTTAPVRGRPLGALLVLLSLAVLPATSLRAQLPPEVEELATAFVRALGGGDPDVAWSVMQETFDPRFLEEHGAVLRSGLAALTSDLEGIEPHGVLATPERIAIVARGGGHAATLRFGWTAEPPYRLVGLEVMPGEAEPLAEEPALSLGENVRVAALSEAVGAFLAEQAAAGELSGSVLVAYRGEPVFRAAYGLADRNGSIPNRVETRFDLGSIQKLLTKTAVASLLAEGRLSLDDTVARWLPAYPDPEVARKITLRHLAEHSSGLGDIFTDGFRDASKTRFREPEDFFPLFAHEPLLFEPGASRSYSNAGYQVLGAVVAAAAGAPFSQVVARRVFEPAGMEASGFFARDLPTPDLAVGYTRDTEDGSLANNLFRLPVVGSPAGSSFSTVDDLLRFERALRGGALVPAPWAAWVLTGAEPTASGRAADPLASFAGGYAGGAPGVSTALEISEPWTVIVLANQDPPAAPETARTLMRSLEGTRISPSP